MMIKKSSIVKQKKKKLMMKTELKTLKKTF